MELPVSMNSLWGATAPTWDHDHMVGPVETDLLIIGAGITGLSAALQASENGLNAVVVDQHHPGWGASGRNGGQVIPGLKLSPHEIVTQFGAARGEQIVDFAGQSADHVFDLISRYNIDCDAVGTGWIEPAYRPRILNKLDDECRQWQALGADVGMLDGPAIAAATGSNCFIGGFLDRRAGSVQPLKYSLGLANAARKAGARIYSGVTVTGIDQRGGKFDVQTTAGPVKAAHVLLCTNGYSDPAFAPQQQPVGRSLVQVVSIQIATDPLPDSLRERIMPDRISGSDAKRLLVYFRQDAEGRFLIGGRGATHASGLNRLFPKLHQHALKLFPELAEVNFTYRWGGSLALTMDHLPHIHEPVPGLVMALGYNGRGVALASQWGAAMADYIGHGDQNRLPIPVSGIEPIHFHRLRTVGIEAAALWYGLLDRLGR
jgi:glycine/D-amino acid oxidase-like deaminating enzyme